jgi:hypothetical protein
MTPLPYAQLVRQVQKSIEAHIPPGATVLIASKGDEEIVRVPGYKAWHFPRDEWGDYAGHHPATSTEALVHLRQLYTLGARYLVFPATSAWWLDYYKELAEHLAASHAVVAWQDGVSVIYRLCESPAFDALAAVEVADAAAVEAATDAVTPIISLTRPRVASPLRVLTILARFGSEQYAGAEKTIADLFARQMPQIERRVVIVDNALPRHVIEERRESVLIGGDNAAREFSGFDRAIDFVGSEIWTYDLVHFATSAFYTLYVAYLERFDTALLQAAAGWPACIGHIDCYDESIGLRGFRAQHWIRSCFFFLPPSEVKALGSLVSVPPDVAWFSGNPQQPFCDDAPLTQRYRDYITRWLTGSGVGQGVEWHSRFALTHETLRAFEQKAVAILNEQMLSVRLQALGCRLVDVTWLSTMLRKRAGVERLSNTSWREQLAGRDRDARVVIDHPADEAAMAVAPAP